MATNRKLVLGASLSGGGNHSGIWRHPRHWSDASINLNYYKQSAQKAESGKFDFIFVGDTLFINEKSAPQLINRFEPLTLLTALAGATSRIGLVGTLSTSYSEPYNVARLFASLDHISGGRAGWNVVTTALPGTALNFNQEQHLEHDERYQVADEFVQVTKGLWDSWEDDAFVRNKETGIYFDPNKLHTLNHQGEYFSVRGPLSIERSQQGQPVLVQAGSSEAGRAFAAKHAEVVFTYQHSIEEAKRFYSDIKARIADNGREPGHLLVLPGISVIIGATEAEAAAKQEEIAGLISIEEALKDLDKYMGGADLSKLPLDEPLPDNWSALGADGFQSAVEGLDKLVREEKLTLRQLALKNAAKNSRNPFVGTPEKIADTIQEWFEAEAVDGFIVGSGPIVPEGIHDFVDHVVPILQRRGLFREDYEADTLRGNLGLPIPANRHAAVR